MNKPRLIDANRIRFMLESDGKWFDDEVDDIMKVIDRMVTAYDLDKVVEQLECATGTVCGHKDNENNGGGCAGCTECKMEEAYRYAIEIVKGGCDE